MFQNTLLHKCKNMRYKKCQTEKACFQENVRHSPLAVKCWNSERLRSSILHRLKLSDHMFVLTYLPFLSSCKEIFRGGRLQKNSPSKKSLNLSLKLAIFSRVR